MEMYVVMRRVDVDHLTGPIELDSIHLSSGSAKDRVIELRDIRDSFSALGDPKSYFWFRKVPVAATAAGLTNFAKYRS